MQEKSVFFRFLKAISFRSPMVSSFFFYPISAVTGCPDTLNRLSGQVERGIRTECPGHWDRVSGGPPDTSGSTNSCRRSIEADNTQVVVNTDGVVVFESAGEASDPSAHFYTNKDTKFSAKNQDFRALKLRFKKY